MDAEDTIREYLAAIEAGNTAKADSLLTDDFTFSGPVPQPMKKRDFLSVYDVLVEALPNWQFNAKNYKTAGNKVTLTVQITGTHTGTLHPLIPGMPAIPATGKKIALPLESLTITMRGDKLAALEAEDIEGGGAPGVLAQIGIQMPR